MTISENIMNIREEIAQAAKEVGRDPKEILLCAATKMNDTKNIRAAIEGGIDCCGENRVQELVQKLSEHAYDGVPIHFIGHLQTNKVKQVVGNVDLIQSVDSERLLEAIQKEAKKKSIVQNILLEVNIADEESKSGFTKNELYDLLPKITLYSNVHVLGFMTIPPICQKSGENDKFFQEMYNLSVDITAKKYDNISVRFLSMGMSDDYKDAIRCGSNMIRIGTAIFGARDYSNTQHQ